MDLDFQIFDAEYVVRLTAGDPEIEARFSIYFDKFLSMKLRSRRLSPEVADDVRQETLYRVLKTLREGDGVRDPNRFGAFVNAVCNNVLLELSHRTARDTPPGEALPEQRDETVAADQSLITAERKQAVAAILNSLSSQDREILRLVFFEERDREEICRRLGKDAGYVRVLLHRAKSRFEAAFEKSYRHLAGLALLVCNGLALDLTIGHMDSWLWRGTWIISKL